MDSITREKKITQTSVTGIIANLFLAGFKAFVGLLSNSIAIVLDAVNNLTDALSSVITIAGVKLAKRRPDNDHPFGHGRVEYFSAILISIIILTAGVSSLVESVKKIFHPETPDFSTLTVIIVATAVVVKFLLGKYVKAQGRKYNSDALVASGTDASMDAVISLATLAGIAVTLLFGITIDGFLGAVIAGFIIKAGVEILLESVGSVIGNRPDSEVTKSIKATVRSIEGVMGAYDLILHDYGPNSAIGSIHVEVAGDMSAEQFHTLTKTIQKTVQEKFNIFITVGMYAVDKKHDAQRKAINAAAVLHQGVLGTHGVYINDENKYASFDVAIDFNVPDKAALEQQIREETGRLLPGYALDLNFDAYYSD